MSSNGNDETNRKLESWKEIAAFFERDLRTVIRWEKELGLPVHRYPGKSKGRVYANANELQAWADGPRLAATEAEKTSDSSVATAELESDITGVEFDAGPTDNRRSRRTLWITAAVGAAIALAVVGWAAWRAQLPRPIASVAVLPFDNLGEEANPAFVEGLTDEIASSLSQLDGLRVAGRRSAYTFQGKRNNLGQVARALNVEAVVEGSVQTSGDHTRVTVQLNRTRDGFTIWARTFDSRTNDWIETESDIASTVAHALSPNAPAHGAAPPGTSDPEARALYLQGRYVWNQRNFDAERKSVEYMRRAIAKDPNYAQAWSGLADSLVTIGNLENVKSTDYIPEAREAARKALQLNGNLADAHAVLGRIAAHYDYDWTTAEDEYKKALTLNPNYATAHQYYALGLMAHGRLAEAQHQLDVASQLDPLALIVGVDKALLEKFRRDYSGVIRESQHVLQLDPNYLTGYSMLATGYYLTKQWSEWRAIDAKYPQRPVTRALASGDLAQARVELAEELRRAERGEVPASVLVGQAVRAGDYQLALNWLDRAYLDHDYWLLFMNVDPENDPIRADPRFHAMMKKLGVE
jgi:TolB-like protein/tetratricopeptide (TPR) repeat protein